MAPKTSDVITVYAKDTLEPRKASFIGSFGAEVQSGNIRYLFPEGCDAPKIVIDPIQAARERQKLIDELQGDVNENQGVNNLRRGSRRFGGNGGENQVTEPTTTSSSTTTTESITTQNVPIESLRGSEDLSQPIDDNNANNGRYGNNNNNNKNYYYGNSNENQSAENSETNDGEDSYSSSENDKNNDDQCCDSERMKILLPRNDIDSCAGSRMAKISIPISSEKLSRVPMKDLMNLSSARSTLTMLKNLMTLAEKYNL